MRQISGLPSVSDIVFGGAVFRDDMPVWCGFFGSDIWPLIDSQSPLFLGHTTSSIVWSDYILGRGATLKNKNSFAKTKYCYCLTSHIVSDLKVAAVIHGNFPKLLKDSRYTKGVLDAKTVKGRIDDLAKFISLVITEAKCKLGLTILRLDQIPFTLVKETIPKFPGRSTHLKRALKLISDPIIQKNLSGQLQWELLDITRSTIAWNETKEREGIFPLLDQQFIFLLNHCKQAIAKFKHVAKLKMRDSECDALPAPGNENYLEEYHGALNAYYERGKVGGRVVDFLRKYGMTATEIADMVRDAHTSSMMLIFLFTGLRSSETKFLMRDCLKFTHGYWFLDSKVVKGKTKDSPLSEGWLAIDITKDAYDILSYISSKTDNPYLFSSPFVGYAKSGNGYRGGALNTKFSRWIKRIDEKGFFASWTFSVHQCRETLVSQLAKQEVGLPFISMQLKHFHSQLNRMPNAVTAAYGNYIPDLWNSISSRIAGARESALMDVYSEDAKFAGGGAEEHKARIDTFFSGLGLFGDDRVKYIKDMARRGAKLMPTSIGSCTKNFVVLTDEPPPPCYGDYQCDPECPSHVITKRSARALVARKEHVMAEAGKELVGPFKVIWLGLAEKLDGHIRQLDAGECDV